MASAQTMEFKRGDGLTHFFQLPVESWTPGGVLYFAAKPSVDNDNADTEAVINKSFDDSKIVLSGDDDYEEGFITYRLDFLPNDFLNITFISGAKKNNYLGEFQYVSALNVPESFPADDKFIDVIVYADIKRGGVA